MKTIEQLEADMLTLKKQIEELKNKPTFEVGKWYKDSLNKVFMFTHKSSGSCFGNLPCGNNYSEVERSTIPATPKEVEDALIKEAVKRGFKDGVMFYRNNLNGLTGKFKANNNDFEYITKLDNLYIGGTCIYSKGQWAEI
jgi:hypothetical protein